MNKKDNFYQEVYDLWGKKTKLAYYELENTGKQNFGKEENTPTPYCEYFEKLRKLGDEGRRTCE